MINLFQRSRGHQGSFVTLELWNSADGRDGFILIHLPSPGGGSRRPRDQQGYHLPPIQCVGRSKTYAEAVKRPTTDAKIATGAKTSTDAKNSADAKMLIDDKMFANTKMLANVMTSADAKTSADAQLPPMPRLPLMPRCSLRLRYLPMPRHLLMQKHR